MKKYPYTDSTDLIVYDKKSKGEKKPHVFRACIASALTASVLTGAIFCGVTVAFNNNSSNTASGITSQQTQTVASTNSSISTTTLDNTTTKQALTIPEIVDKCGSSVVGVINKTTVQSQKYYDPFTGRYYYYTDPSTEGETETQGTGSGIIISEDGYIVTNQHVIEDATEISVILNTGEEYTAELIGQDEKTDLAVLKIEASVELNAAELGDSTTVKVGELAVAIGNPLGQELAGTTTAGIVSAVNRTMTVDNRTYNLIQTDAAINAGNSGGALINQYGEVIGINSVKVSSSDVEGIGFAIAISEAKPIIEELIEQGHVTRPLVGVSIRETAYGLFVASVTEGSGAEKAGMQVKDMIISVDGVEVSSVQEINAIRDTKQPGDEMVFQIVRNGQSMEITVTLGESTE